MTPFLNSRHAGSSIHPPSCTAVVLQVLREAAECEGLDVREPTDDQVAAWWVLLGPSSEGARTVSSAAETPAPLDHPVHAAPVWRAGLSSSSGTTTALLAKASRASSSSKAALCMPRRPVARQHPHPPQQQQQQCQEVLQHRPYLPGVGIQSHSRCLTPGSLA
jgi:hypothetical protein